MKKRSECNCPCHKPGARIRHIMPCCVPDSPEDYKYTVEHWITELSDELTDKSYDNWLTSKLEEYYGPSRHLFDD